MKDPNRPASTAEERRLRADKDGEAHWKLWGPYLAERAWGTVREDYSASGEAWEYFPHDHARSRVYRWNEDGLAGICDDHQNLCFALALWNGTDPVLKERLFGLTGNEGNHGEDVKEYYFYLDSTPTHSYMKYLYKYPQAAYPYADLVTSNAARGRHEPEYELIDTGVFADDRYFDVFVEYAKAGPEDVLIRITARIAAPAQPSPAADGLVPQHLVLGPTTAARAHRAATGPGHAVPPPRPRRLRALRARWPAVHDNETNERVCSGRRTRRRT
jgi:hypothetical protein